MEQSFPPLKPDKLTWAVLLGKWVDFARSALALPDDEQGRKLRDSVTDIITLQAVWFALQHLDELDAAQRAVGIDRAELLIEKHSGALQTRFGDGLPEQLLTLIGDAQEQLEKVAKAR